MAFLQGFRKHMAKDRHLTSRSISLTANIRFTITHSLHFQLQVESRLFLEAGLALRSHTSPTEGFEGDLSVTVFLCPRRRCNPSLQSMLQVRWRRHQGQSCVPNNCVSQPLVEVYTDSGIVIQVLFQREAKLESAEFHIQYLTPGCVDLGMASAHAQGCREARS